MIEEIEGLPTYDNQDRITHWLKRVMEDFDAGLIDHQKMIECLYELADQQWHQYGPQKCVVIFAQALS